MIVTRSPAPIRRDRPGPIRSAGASRFGRIVARPRRIDVVGPDVWISTGTPSAQHGGTAENLNDFDTGTVCSTTFPNFSGQPEENRVVWRIDYGKVRTLHKIEVRGAKYTTPNAHAYVGYSQDGVSYTDLSGVFLFSASETDLVYEGNYRARYIAVIGNDENNTGAVVQCQDLNGYGPE